LNKRAPRRPLPAADSARGARRRSRDQPVRSGPGDRRAYCRRTWDRGSQHPLVAAADGHALGAWEGLTYVEIDDRFPGARQAREADKWRYVIAGGESYALASERAKRWLAGCAAALTVAVTHEMMSRAIQGAYASLSPAETLARSHPQNRLYRLDGGAITEMVIA
jgi:hypothetical protein